MNQTIRKVVVVGGGTAGWLVASLLAARHDTSVQVTLIESPEVPTVGVGEGTWPTMRKTLKRIGISEKEFLTTCDASFKQGSRFDGWVNGESDDSYLHPFASLIKGSTHDVYAAWKNNATEKSFAQTMCPQAEVCAQSLAPKQKNAPDFAAALNYGYHLDAVKLAKLLSTHATDKLGVKHIRDHVTEVVGKKDEDIAGVITKQHGEIKGDLFIDCTGHASILLGRHYGVEFIDKSNILFNDRALTTHVPLETPDDPIASQTISTAHAAGWIWDIGLPSRRGLGCVYSSKHFSDDQAEATFENHIKSISSVKSLDELNVRKLSFPSGHRATFWHRNCIAIGLSAGFLEPLEASAIVLVELSVEALVENFPVNRSVMDIFAKRFNKLFLYRWERIIDFLKLHYVLSKRTQAYWQDHRSDESIPDRLKELLEIWKHQPPDMDDFLHIDEVFPAASYLYVLYGMGYETSSTHSLKPLGMDEVFKQMQLVQQQVRAFTAVLPTNRSLLASLKTLYNSEKNTTQRYA